VVSGRPPILGLRLNSRPDSAGLVRAALGGLTGPFRLREELVSDLKTTISEACNNAVEHAYRGQSGAIAVHVDIGFESVDVSVRDWGGGFQHVAPAGDHLRVGLPVINALADRAEFLTAPGSGTEVRMGFDIRHDPRREGILARVEESEDLEAWTPWRRGLSGDVVVTLLPRELLGGVLEPLISALAARSRFSLERFSDIYLVSRAIAAHVESAASSGRVSFALGADEHRIDMTIGPLQLGAAERLRGMSSSDRLEASVARLADEVLCESIETSELLRIVVRNGERDLSTTNSGASERPPG
jgi:anti-sigma regulatory factor (Ser/Thr protein kinase)